MNFSVSTRKHKKYSVVTPKGKVVHFGDKRYSQYKDSVLGVYSNLDNNDTARRRSYRRRARGIKNRRGKAVYKHKESPAYYSYNFLW